MFKNLKTLQFLFLHKLSFILKILFFDTTHAIIAKWKGLKIGLTILDRLTKLESLPYLEIFKKN